MHPNGIIAEVMNVYYVINVNGIIAEVKNVYYVINGYKNSQWYTGHRQESITIPTDAINIRIAERVMSFT